MTTAINRFFEFWRLAFKTAGRCVCPRYRQKSTPERPGGGYRICLEGMPEVHLARPPVAPREYIPWLWIYLPVAAKWLQLAARHRCLTLPTIANPYIESGGFRGESKFSYLRQISPNNERWLCRSVPVRITSRDSLSLSIRRADQAITESGLSYPVVVKPDIGACGYGVRLVHDIGDLSAYVERYPKGQTLMIQEYLSWAGEAGIYYMRIPGEARGRIYSLGLRYYPHVVGDGNSTLRHLIEADPRASRCAGLHRDTLGPRLHEVPARGQSVRLALVASLRLGALYRDGSPYVTEAMTRRFDDIAQSMPEFYCGRFDVRFESIDKLKDGESFRIIEVNGVGAEAIHIWDPQLTLGHTYKVLFELHELIFRIAAHNRARGFRPLNISQVIGLQWKESRLLRAYPVSN